MSARSESPATEPYALGSGSRGEALLLHGLTGLPWDMRPIAEALAERGVRAHAPQLAGHDSVDALEDSTWLDWYESAERALLDFDEPPLVVGLSMGGLLALRLAARSSPRVRAVAALATPLNTARWKIQAASTLSRLRAVGPLRAVIGRHRKRRVDVRIQRVAQRSPSFASLPYAAVAELGELQVEVSAVLEDVRAPLLLLHGRFDHSASPRDSWQIAQRVSSSQVRRVVLPRSYHLLTRDLDQQRVCKEIVHFLDSLSRQPPDRA